MGCGCKDIEQDQKIIEYYNNKKQMEETPVSPVTFVTWFGHLSDWSMYIENEDCIIRVEHINDQWMATIKNTEITDKLIL